MPFINPSIHRTMSNEEEIQGRQRRFWVAAAVIVTAAFFLRIYHIGWQELWLDEVQSFYLATSKDWIQRMLNDPSPPLYYVLLHAWIGLAGESESALRLLSAVLGTLFVAAAIAAGREFFNPSAGLWSGLFAAVAPIHIYYSQEARAYALLVLALMLVYITLWRALKKNNWRSWILFSLYASVALYSHYFALLGLLSTVFLPFLDARRTAQTWVRYGGALLLSFFLLALWLAPALAFQQNMLAQVSWTKEAWKGLSPFLQIPRSLEVLGLGSQSGLLWLHLKQFDTLEFPVLLRLSGLTVLLLLGVIVAVPWSDGRLGIPRLTERKAGVGLALLSPLLLLWLASFYKPFYVAGRYDMVAFPAYVLLVGLALAKVQSSGRLGRPLSLILALALFTPIGVKLVLYYRAAADDHSRRTAKFLSQSVNNGDAVVFTGFGTLPSLYYLKRLGYEWDGNYCDNRLTGRLFVCRRFPYEQVVAHPASNLSLAVDPHDKAGKELIGSISKEIKQKAVIWLVFGVYKFSQGMALVTDADLLLVKDLAQSGFLSEEADRTLGIVRFRPR